jgi:DNA end-binding protein Ku
MDILQFVARQDVDPIYFQSSYYVAPEEAVSKPYALFLAALVETEHDAIAKVAMHNREHVVLIRPSDNGLVLHTLFYPDELHKANKMATPKSKYSAKELAMAKSLVDHLTAPFKPDAFHDTYRENVERLIKEKEKGGKITTVQQPRKPPAIDILEALKRSLAAKKRPAAEKPARQKRVAAKKVSHKRKAA